MTQTKKPATDRDLKALAATLTRMANEDLARLAPVPRPRKPRATNRTRRDEVPI